MSSYNAINKLSKVFQPIIAVPKNARFKNQDLLTSNSQKLMLELGIIKQASPGSFHLLPFGIRSLNKLTKIVDNELTKIGAQKVALPTLTNAKLWQATGRMKDVGPELFTLQDRHNHTYILSPTHEESISDLLASISPVSYKHFPLRLYQITSKFRDEIKPRFGLMRSRQFVMKDMYSFDIDKEHAAETYREVCDCYDNIFKRIGVDFVKVSGFSGAMGGSVSHEYHYIAPIGEDQLLTCSKCGYSANIELSGDKECPQCSESGNIKISTGIEVGHTFMLGQKYSDPLKATYLSEKGKPVVLQMGSYGLGLTRIIAAAIEVLSNNQEIRWPDSFAPYSVIIIPPKEGSKEEPLTAHLGEHLYTVLNSFETLQDDVMLDDRTSMTIGRRVLEARRVGYPFIIVIGSRATESPPVFEINYLKTDTHIYLPENALLDFIKEKCSY